MRTATLKTLLLALALLVSSSALAATVWKWVDKNGITHYSDQPVPGAVQIDLNVQTYDAEEAALPTTTRTNRTKDAAAPAYQLLEIWKPANEQTFAGTAGQVSVAIRLDPGIQPGHSVRLELDGQRVSQPNGTALDFELKEISRGAHTLSASVVTSTGETLIQSAPVTFFMQQPSVLRKKN